jgi:HD-GYP domain-containing protein (c-di-GMP phosphodiesterase class II)
VLNKPGALTDEERSWIQEHPVVGVDIVGRAPSLREALTVIRQHHERFDGRGYPDGLAGEQISLAARIVAVADVWDALTSDRAYRPAWPPTALWPTWRPTAAPTSTRAASTPSWP